MAAMVTPIRCDVLIIRYPTLVWYMFVALECCARRQSQRDAALEEEHKKAVHYNCAARRAGRTLGNVPELHWIGRVASPKRSVNAYTPGPRSLSVGSPRARRSLRQRRWR